MRNTPQKSNRLVGRVLPKTDRNSLRLLLAAGALARAERDRRLAEEGLASVSPELESGAGQRDQRVQRRLHK
jgi:hypothetical protein